MSYPRKRVERSDGGSDNGIGTLFAHWQRGWTSNSRANRRSIYIQSFTTWQLVILRCANSGTLQDCISAYFWLALPAIPIEFLMKKTHAALASTSPANSSAIFYFVISYFVAFVRDIARYMYRFQSIDAYLIILSENIQQVNSIIFLNFEINIAKFFKFSQ